MDSFGNINHAVSIVGYWIFDSNYKKALSLTLYSCNLICSPSEVEESVAMFETLFHTVIYINNTGKLNIID